VALIVEHNSSIMSKNRFTASDVKAMVRDIRSSILGQRVANIYDLSDKIYLFKFAVPGVAKKIFLLVESGMRFHTTRYTRDKNDMPSPFAMKLRKHIRLKRLEDIRQLGSDRVVDLKFGSGDAICHIILELYASGNIVLTDGNYEIIALLRSHKFEDDIAVQMGEIYPIAFTTTVAPTASSSATVSIAPSDGACSTNVISNMTSAEFLQWTRARYDEMVLQNEEQQRLKSEADKVVTVATANNGKGKKNNTPAGPKKQRLKKMNMRQLLLCKESGVALFGPEILDHCLLMAGLVPATKVEDFIKSVEATGEDEMHKISRLLEELRDSAPGLLALLDTPGQPGYILCKKTKPMKKGELEGDTKTDEVPETETLGDYYDFVPRMFKQHEGEDFKEMGSFDEAVDEYFCKVEEQRLQHHALSAEEAAKKKVKKVKDEMRNQLQGLADTQLKMEKAACLTEAFAEEVDKAFLVINSALGAGISWDDISTMVAAETAAGNHIASIIAKLKLDKNRVVIRLPDILEDSDSDTDEDDISDEDESQVSQKSGKKKAFVDVDLDLSLSAYANASKLYSQRKVARNKEAKTAVAAERAIKAVEMSSSKQLVKQQVKRNLQAQRKVHWFEKFNWFITSEGYLVLSGRDAQQNEQLVKKYLRPGDAYVHADMHGASSCIVRCKVSRDAVTGSETPLPISPFALNEAGTMTICRSGAWSVKVVMSAWWVHASQVSKTAPTGEYLSTGSFMIYGKKNFLPPTSLEMGFGILFRLDDGSVSRHLSERVDKTLSVDEAPVNIEREPDVPKSASGKTNPIPEGDRSSTGHKEKEGRKGRQSRAQRLAEDMKTDTQVEGESIQIESLDNQADIEMELSSSTATENVEVEEQIPVNDIKLDVETDQGNDVKDISNNSAEDQDAVMEEKKKSGKAKLTPYQRKMLKKGMTLEEIEQAQALKQKEKGEKEALAAALKEELDEADEDDVKDSGPMKQSAPVKKKKLNKKKARRYADQDEDDVRLAMMALGHGGKQKGTNDANDVSTEGEKSQEVSRKQEKAGIHLLQADWETSMNQLPEVIREQLAKLVRKKLIKDGELDPFELTTLGTFSPEEGLEILSLFDCENCTGIGNKSGFLAGIMRRFSKNKEKNIIKQRQQEQAKVNLQGEDIQNSENFEEDDDALDLEPNATSAISRRERKKVEAKEIQMILQEEGVLDEQEGKLADELEKLTGIPMTSDVLLYAVPVCGPFAALKNLKYKVKLTPGTIKKGKACKNAVEVFVNSKNYSVGSGGGISTSPDVVDSAAAQIEATNRERALIKGLTDPEMVAIMIGDVKLSMPGLYSTLKKKKEQSKKAKKK